MCASTMEILRMFPMWEYRCPKCGTFLGYEVIDYCVKCGSTFSHLRARVPPRFFKNKKAMREYAERYLFPKLSPMKRKLLREFLDRR